MQNCDVKKIRTNVILLNVDERFLLIMSGNPVLGPFLLAGDVNQAAMFAVHCFQEISDHDMEVIKKILECNWEDELQIVANLLQNPFLIPEDIRIDCLIRGLNDIDTPYYILSAALGVQRLQLNETDELELLKCLRSVVFNEQGVISMRAFIALQPHLKYPTDNDLFVKILNMPKSSLHDSALSWMVLQTNDKKDLLSALQKGNVPDHLVSMAEKKMDEHCESLAHGEESPVSIEVFDYIPNLIDFEAMLDKEETLAEFFEDLDTDNNNKLSADEVKTFLEDIGKDVDIEEIVKEMKSLGVGDDCKIDKDGFIEMMFPKFNIQ